MSAVSPTVATMPVDLMRPLSKRDTAILDFERTWWKYAGAKATAIQQRFGMSDTRYYQVLSAIIEKPGALEVDPMTVRRLRRLRDERRRARGARRALG